MQPMVELVPRPSSNADSHFGSHSYRQILLGRDGSRLEGEEASFLKSISRKVSQIVDVQCINSVQSILFPAYFDQNVTSSFQLAYRHHSVAVPELVTGENKCYTFLKTLYSIMTDVPISIIVTVWKDPQTMEA